MTDSNTTESVIFINPVDFGKLLYYPTRSVAPQARPHELGGFGFYNPEKNEIYGLFMVPQTVTGSTVDFEEMGWQEKVVTMKNPERCRVWWHSHADMSCFLSGTDHSTMNFVTDQACP